MLITSRGQEEAVLSVEDWAEIRRLRKSEGMAIKVISRKLGISGLGAGDDGRADHRRV